MIGAMSKIGCRSMQINAVVIGVDGKPKRDLGTIAYWHRNPLRRLWFKLVKFFGGV